jgi:GR25 family glycosyltransferase involved in LPS biosynthesis
MVKDVTPSSNAIMDLKFDKSTLSENIELAKSLIKTDTVSAQRLAFNIVLKQLEVQYDDDKPIFDLLDALRGCKIDNESYIGYNPEKCAALGAAIVSNRARGISPDSITICTTTCKRYDLFVKTVNSFLACCEDLGEFLYEWIVVDDNSSESDRKLMQDNYPFITYVFKTPDQKGHARSMNMLMDLIKTPYVFNLEDDWRFFAPARYLSKCFEVLRENPRYGQCLLNRAYGEDIDTAAKIVAGHRRYTASGLRYYIHEYATGAALNTLFKKLTNIGQGNCSYWPHYSLRAGITRTEVFDRLGKYNEDAKHFEQEYAYRYRIHYLTTYLDNLYCTHTGRRTYERDSDKINAYDLNAERQFGQDPKNIPPNSHENRLDPLLPAQTTREIPNKPADSVNSNPVPVNRELRRLVMKTYVLNLRRRPDRLQKFRDTNALELENFHVFWAVDGKKMVPNHVVQKLFEHNDYNYRRGLVGCALSHLLMWVELVESQTLQGMLIAEDDAELTGNFLAKFMHALAISPEADILFLGHHPYPAYARAVDMDRTATPITELWSKERSIKQSMGGTTAYYITKQGAANMLNWINKHGFRYGVDWEMFHNDANKVYYTSPFLAFADCAQSGKPVDTDIQHVYDGTGFSLREWFAEELAYWGESGTRNDFAECPKVEKSKAVYRGGKCSKKELLEYISIFDLTDDMKSWLNTFPVHWYSINKYIISIPDNRISDKDFNLRTFYTHLSLQSIKNIGSDKYS